MSDRALPAGTSPLPYCGVGMTLRSLVYLPGHLWRLESIYSLGGDLVADLRPVARPLVGLNCAVLRREWTLAEDYDPTDRDATAPARVRK